MIKKQHFVALAASLVLVLSGCETTDLVTDGISATQEENTVIELVGPNGKSGSIKLPESENTEDTGKEPEKESTETTQGTESEENKEDETKSSESENKADENENQPEENTEEKAEETKSDTEEKTESDEKTGTDESEKKDESVAEEEKKDEKTEEKSDESEKTAEDEKTEEKASEDENENPSEKQKSEEKTDETGKTDEKTEENKSGETSEEKTEETVPEKDYSENNKILMQKVEAARMAAIDAGAKSAAPAIWNVTEGIYNTEKGLVDSGTKADLSSVLNDLIARYQGLENLAQAKDLKDEIDENNLASFRQPTYDAGAKILSDLTNPLSTIQSGADFNKQAATAESDFRLVLRTAYNSLAQNERTAAYEAKLKADSVKAYVSRKDEYTKAVTLYRNGELRRSVDPKLANESYKMSKEQFLTLFTEISAARAQAQKEIDEAKKSVKQSADAAEHADAEAPLGNEPVEGIEAEDAKLLEDDDFSDAGEAAVIEAPVDE
ncbi:MAG: hypothetical protein II114_09885 [Treponema sp.]|nr:hypothetical protein [Treponema sp.]